MPHKEYTVVFKTSANCWKKSLAIFTNVNDARKYISMAPRDSYLAAKIMVRTVPEWEEFKE